MHVNAPGWLGLLVVAGLLPLLGACTVLEEAAVTPTSTPAPAPNLLLNPGFEGGDTPWIFRDQPEWSGFRTTEEAARSGEAGLRLELRDPGDASGVHIAGAVQEVRGLAEFPEFISGFYRVEDWQPQDVAFQYVQFVVVVAGGDYGDEYDSHQIRVPLAGAESEPFQLLNARWLFLSRDQPVVGEWVYFGYPLRQAFIDKWGKAPATWDGIEIFLEVRYDGKTAADSGMSADVSFDDLYLGTQAGNPNRPED
jgi:hypothetical protein